MGIVISMSNAADMKRFSYMRLQLYVGLAVSIPIAYACDVVSRS